MSLVFWGKLTTGQKTREHSWVVGSYQLILATSLSQLCSKVTANSLGHGPHPPWAVRGCPRHRWQPLLGGTIVPRCLELPTPALPCPDVAGHCRWQLCDHQTKVNNFKHLILWTSFPVRLLQQQQVLSLSCSRNILIRSFGSYVRHIQKRDSWC